MRPGGPPPKHEDPAKVVRTALGFATLGTAVAGFLADDGTRLLVASGAFGVIWWCWDLLMDFAVRPFTGWLGDLASGGRSYGQAAPTVSVDRRIAILERRLEMPKTKRAYIQTALRLAELYELQTGDRKRAREVIGLARARYPDVAVLAEMHGRLEEP